jgi:hypothetical protein
LLPEERESLLATEAKLDNVEARLAMSAPLSGTRAVQQRLAELGYKPGPVDGMMGPRTPPSAPSSVTTACPRRNPRPQSSPRCRGARAKKIAAK